jgi:hypothetical protein
MTKPDAKRARAANCGPVNCAWAAGGTGEPMENSRKTLRGLCVLLVCYRVPRQKSKNLVKVEYKFVRKLYEGLSENGFVVWWDRVSMPGHG